MKNFIKISKKESLVYKKYTLGTRTIKKQITSIHKKKNRNKIEWLPTTDNQSDKVLKKRSLMSGIVLLESSKLQLFFPRQMHHIKQWGTAPISPKGTTDNMKTCTKPQ